MLNKYPLWKYILILAVLAIGLIYSAPNLYPDDPAIQISGASTALQVNQADLDRVSTALRESGINVKAASLAANGKGGLIRVAPDGAGGWAFNSPGMYRAMAAHDGTREIAIYGDE